MTLVIHDRQEQLDSLLAKLMAAKAKSPKRSTGSTSSQSDESDEDLIARAGRAKNGAKFKALWAGDWSGYQSQSEADLALCCHLAFWTQGDADRIDRLFRQSGLMRDKWEREEYRADTIKRALELVTEYYTPYDGVRIVDWPPKPSANGHHANGHSNNGEPPPPDAPDGDQECAIDNTGYGMILAHFKHYYQPTFKRGLIMFSGALGREVKNTQACYSATHELVRQLDTAIDAPCDNRGRTERNKLPQFFRTWAPVAWTDLLATLPEEDQTAEIVEPAGDEFKAAIAASLHSLVSLGHRYEDDKGEATEIERRSLFDFAKLFAKPGPWKQIRSYWVWCRRDEESHRVAIAIRVDLFDQLHKGSELTKLGAVKFGKLATLYSVGTPIKAAGSRAVELTPDFVNELNGHLDAS